MLLPCCPWSGQDLAVPLLRKGIPPRLRWSRVARRDPRAVSPVSIVWPCPLPADVYAAAGREVEFPRPDCPSCAVPMVFWSGYRRYVREAGCCWKIFVPRVRCGPCAVSHALLPAFVLVKRLDAAEVIGGVVAEVAGGACGVRPAAARAGVPYTKARGGGGRVGRPGVR